MGNLRTSLATVVVLAVITLLSASCQESLEERCARESREFNEKKCPAKVADGVMLDSLIFERENHTLHYYYTFSGKADDPEAIEKLNPRKILIDEVRNSTSIQRGRFLRLLLLLHMERNRQRLAEQLEQLRLGVKL